MAIDKSERKILKLLQAHGRMSNVELAQRSGLSESPCFRRVLKYPGVSNVESSFSLLEVKCSRSRPV